MKKLMCMECEDVVNNLFEDMRNPPLDEDVCLCKECYISSIIDEIDTKNDELEELNRLLINAKGS